MIELSKDTCDHDYEELGYLIVSRGDPRTTYESRYVCPNIIVYQCRKCGDILFLNKLWERIFKSGTESES